MTEILFARLDEIYTQAQVDALIAAFVSPLTPWSEDIDADAFDLHSVGQIAVGAAQDATARVSITASAADFPDGWGNNLKLIASDYPALWFYSSDQDNGLIYAWDSTTGTFWMEPTPLGETGIGPYVFWDYGNNAYYVDDGPWDLGISTNPWGKLYINSIELGHATANTLTASGGVLSIEGVALLTAAAADALFLTPAEGNAAYQPLDADLTAIAALATAAYGRSLLTLADEDALEALLDTLPNLVSIQGRTVTLADAGVDAILGWDDSANAYENLTSAEAFAVIKSDADAVYQPLDADLTSWAGVTRAANFDTFVATPTAANLAALLTNDAFLLSDVELGALAGLASAADKVPYFTGAGTADIADFTAYGRTLVALADEAALEALIDTLANLTSIQGRTVTLADAGFDVLFGWDDSGSAYKNFVLADITAEASPASGDFFLLYGAEGDLRKVDVDDMPGGEASFPADPGFDALLMWDDSGSAAKWTALAEVTSEGAPAAGDFLLVLLADNSLAKVDWDDLPSGGVVAAEDVTFTPAGNLAAEEVQAALEELDAEKQPLDADLTSWAGVARAAGFDTFVATPSLANLGTLLTNEAAGVITFMTTPSAANFASMVTDDLFSLADAELAALAGLTSAADRVPYFTGSGTADVATFTAYGRTLVALADEAALEALLDTLANLTSIQGRTVTLADAGANAFFGWDDTASAYENLTAAEAEAIIEPLIDTLANLTSVQGLTLTYADAGFDVLRGWDDSAAANKNLLLADITAEGTPASGDFFLLYGAEGDLRKVDFDDMPGGGSGLTLAQIMALVTPTAAAHSGGNLTLDVDDGNVLFFTRTMAGDETVLNPTNMPVGATIYLLVEPGSQENPTFPAAPTDTASTAAGTTHAITMPASIVAGELLIIVFSVDGAPTVTEATGTWNRLGQASNTTVVTGAIFWKIAEGSDTCTLTTSASEEATATTYRVKRCKGIEGTNANGSSTNSDPPAITPTGGSQDYTWIATRSGDAAVVATVSPSGYGTLRSETGGANSASTNSAELAETAQTTENPGVFTSATEQWVSWTLALHPSGFDLMYDTGFASPKFFPRGLRTLLAITQVSSGEFVVAPVWAEAS